MGIEKLTIRRVKDTDFETIQKWYSLKERPYPPKWTLGDIGFIVESNKVPACSGFLNPTSIGICFLEHVETNPGISKMSQARAYVYFIREIILIIKDMGFRGMAGFVPEYRQSIKKLYERMHGASVEGSFFYREV